MAIALFNKEDIICVGDSYISGGMFRIGEEHYARTVKTRKEKLILCISIEMNYIMAERFLSL